MLSQAMISWPCLISITPKWMEAHGQIQKSTFLERLTSNSPKPYCHKSCEIVFRFIARLFENRCLQKDWPLNVRHLVRFLKKSKMSLRGLEFLLDMNNKAVWA